MNSTPEPASSPPPAEPAPTAAGSLPPERDLFEELFALLPRIRAAEGIDYQRACTDYYNIFRPYGLAALRKRGLSFTEADEVLQGMMQVQLAALSLGEQSAAGVGVRLMHGSARSLGRFLNASLRYRALDFFRDRAEERSRQERLLVEYPDGLDEGALLGADEETALNEAKALVRERLEKLRPKDREAIRRHYLLDEETENTDERTPDDGSDDSDPPKPNAKTTQSRALRAVERLGKSIRKLFGKREKPGRAAVPPQEPTPNSL